MADFGHGFVQFITDSFKDVLRSEFFSTEGDSVKDHRGPVRSIQLPTLRLYFEHAILSVCIVFAVVVETLSDTFHCVFVRDIYLLVSCSGAGVIDLGEAMCVDMLHVVPPEVFCFLGRQMTR